MLMKPIDPLMVILRISNNTFNPAMICLIIVMALS